MSAQLLSLPLAHRAAAPPADGQLPGESHPAASPRPRTLVADLSTTNRLVLWTLRALGECQSNWPIVQQELWLCCGPVTIETVLQGLDEVLQVLVLHGRHAPCVGGVTDRKANGDELALLGLLASAQAKDAARMESLGCWLVRAAGRPTLARQGGRLADGLMRSGLDLRPVPANASTVTMQRKVCAERRDGVLTPPAGA